MSGRFPIAATAITHVIGTVFFYLPLGCRVVKIAPATLLHTVLRDLWLPVTIALGICSILLFDSMASEARRIIVIGIAALAYSVTWFLGTGAAMFAQIRSAAVSSTP